MDGGIMSYCRWSSDGWRSDVYVYESYAGFMTHLAGRRQIGLETLPPDPMMEFLGGKKPDEGWSDRYSAYQEARDALPYVDIDLPEAGASFRHATAQECADNLIRLQALGYHVPEDAIDGLLEDASALSRNDSEGAEK